MSFLITKTKPTEKQALKDLDTRIQKNHELYKIKDKQALEGKTVLVIDDVFTTGATVNEFSKALKKCGVAKIYVFTIASGSARKISLTSIKKNIKNYTRAELMRQ